MREKTSLQDLQSNIRDNLASLTRTEKKIAKYLLECHNEIVFLSIHDLADKLDVGRASIVRLANKLGYSGYASLKDKFKEEIRNDIAPLEKFKLVLSDPSVGSQTIHQIAQQEVENINYTLNNYDANNLRQAVDILFRAQNIYLVGMSISSYLAEITGYLLKRIGLRAIQLNQIGLNFIEQLITIDKKDVLVAFSLPPYSRESIDAAEFAKRKGAKVISITNSLTSPVVNFSDIPLLAKTDSNIFSNSISAVLVVIYALTSEIAAKNKKRSIKAIDQMIDLR